MLLKFAKGILFPNNYYVFLLTDGVRELRKQELM